MKIYVIGNSPQYVAMFQREGYEVVGRPEESDAIQFTGGEDVTPSLYGEHKHPTTHNNPIRDAREEALFERYVGEKIMLGICRGAQFLHVMNGGKLVQDVQGHVIGHTHPCYSLLLGKYVEVTSTHHQMMCQNFSGYVDGWALGIGKNKEGMTVDGEVLQLSEGPQDVEVIIYPDNKTLCFQPHPELSGAYTTRDYYFKLLNELVDAQ